MLSFFRLRARSWLSTLTVCACACACAHSPAAFSTAQASAHPLIGIGDNTMSAFKDPRFLALGIHYVRYDMAWNALNNPLRRAEVIAWMDAAASAHLQVLVTFDHAEGRRRVRFNEGGRTRTHIINELDVMPTTAQYLQAFKAFRALFPDVTQFVTWDETNCYCEVSHNRYHQIASFYLALRRACPACTILAADFLDDDNAHGAVPMQTWVHALDRDIGYQPQYWGLNNYQDVNTLTSNNTRKLLALVRGRIWLVETAGLIRFGNVHDLGFSENAKHAARADYYLLHTLAELSPRIQRIYLYQWKARPDSGWDSALVTANNRIRPGYDVLARALFDFGVKPDCLISTAPPTCR
jgi:hypothetical protein